MWRLSAQDSIKYMSFVVISFTAYFIAISFRTFMGSNLKYIKILNKLLNFKPFTCVMCLSIWIAMIISIVLYLKGDLVNAKALFFTATSSAGFATALSKLTGF